MSGVMSLEGAVIEVWNDSPDSDQRPNSGNLA